MKSILKNIGTSDKETEAFLKMLPLGAQPVSVIAKHIDVPRSSMYAILERLKKLNLVEQFERMGITYFKCIPVKILADVLTVKEKQIDQSLKILEKKMPEFEAMENKMSITPKVIFLEGKKRVMKMYEEILKENEFYAIFNVTAVKKLMPEYVYKVAEKLKEKNGKAKEILVDSKEARKYKKLFDSQNHRIKILAPDVFFSADIIMCTNKIFMVSYGEKEICATEIINSPLAHTQRILFEQLWNRI